MTQKMDFNETFDIEKLNFSDYVFSIDYNCTHLARIDGILNDTNCSMGNSAIFDGEGTRLDVIIKVVMQVCYALAFTIGLTGNTLVIWVVRRFSKMQTVTNLYILNLAIADELFVIGIPFLMITSWLGFWPFGSFMCKIYMIMTSLNQFTSSLILTIMSADRYIAVCHPISSPKLRTHMISKLVSITAWTISGIMIVPVFMYASTLEVYGEVNCNIFWPDHLQTAFTLYTFIITFGIPVIFFVIFYSLVIIKLRSVGPATRSKEKKKSHRKVTRLVLTVISVYVICCTPYWVLQLILISSEPKQNQSPSKIILFLISSCLSYVNSAINPILYAFLSENFKKSFIKACTCVNRNDANNALHFETSIFPRRQRSTRPSIRPARDRETSITSAVNIRENQAIPGGQQGATVSRPTTLTTCPENDQPNGHPKNIISSDL